MRVRSGLPVGVNAAFFDEARRVRSLEGRLSSRLEQCSFSEVLLPILDYYEPYRELLGGGPAQSKLRSVEGESAEQLYRFVDRDGQLLALRYDFTPMLARLVAPRVSDWDLPVRMFYRGDVVRFQEPRPGLLRESAQLGAEMLDRPGTSNEQEMLELFVDLLLSGLRASTEDGLPKHKDKSRALQIVLGVANVLDPLIAAAPDPVAAARALAKRDRRGARAAGVELEQVVANGAPDDPKALGQTGSEKLGALFRCKQRLEEFVAQSAGTSSGRPSVRVAVDLAEFAEFGGGGQEGEHPYYDGLVFRAYTAHSAQPVGNGGRYDGLFKALGADVSAAGFSIGLDQLLEASA